jgi:uncharacterized repeat protein (TIGR01451 family)
VVFYSDPNCDASTADGAEITDTPLLGGTLLSDNASAGSTTITVQDVSNIVAGDVLVINAGAATTETVTVQSVDVQTKTITLQAALTNSYTQGAKVSEKFCAVMKVLTTSTTAAGDYNIVITANSRTSGASDTIDALLRVNTICSISVSPDHSDQLPPNGTTTFQHTVTNSGNGTTDVTITVPSSGTQLTYLILDSTSTPQGTSYTISNLAPGATATFYVKVFAPASVPVGTVESIDVTATASSGCSATATDTTTIIEGYLLLTKTATTADTGSWDSSTSTCTNTPDGVEPGPCDEITYSIRYENIGSQDALNVLIVDAIPQWTTYVTGSLCLDTNCDGTCDSSLTDASGDDTGEYDSSANLVRFRVGTDASASQGGTVAPGEFGCVQFKVRIQ